MLQEIPGCVELPLDYFLYAQYIGGGDEHTAELTHRLSQHEKYAVIMCDSSFPSCVRFTVMLPFSSMP
jgi:hypothetical protein